MTDHKTGTREEWLAARLELLEAEKELTRRGDELARWRQELPWVRVAKQYRFDTGEGPASLADLFAGRSQLLVYHFMFGPDYSAGCPSCSAIADGFDGFVVHLANHDVTLCAVSRAPQEKIQAYRRRMGWGSVGNRRVQLPPDGYAALSGGRQGGAACRVGGQLRHGLADVHAGAPGYKHIRARGRRRLPHLFGLRAWLGRPVGHVPVAGPGTARTKRDACPRRPPQLVPPPRRVRQPVTGAGRKLWAPGLACADEDCSGWAAAAGPAGGAVSEPR